MYMAASPKKQCPIGGTAPQRHWVDGRTDGRADGWPDGRADGWTGGRADGLHGRTDRRADIYIYIHREKALLLEFFK